MIARVRRHDRHDVRAVSYPHLTYNYVSVASTMFHSSADAAASSGVSPDRRLLSQRWSFVTCGATLLSPDPFACLLAEGHTESDARIVTDRIVELRKSRLVGQGDDLEAWRYVGNLCGVPFGLADDVCSLADLAAQIAVQRRLLPASVSPHSVDRC